MALTTHPPSSAEVKKRVELYLYSPSVSSWPVLEWTVAFPSGEECLIIWNSFTVHLSPQFTGLLAHYCDLMVLNHMTYAYDDLAPGCYLVCESIHLDSKLTLEIVTCGGGPAQCGRIEISVSELIRKASAVRWTVIPRISSVAEIDFHYLSQIKANGKPLSFSLVESHHCRRRQNLISRIFLFREENFWTAFIISGKRHFLQPIQSC